MRFDSKFKVAHSETLAPTEATVYVPVEVRTEANGSRGLFAKRSLRAGTVLGRDGGTIVTSTADAPRRNVAVVVGPGLLLAPSDYDNLNELCFINHSCNSNLARIGGLVYVVKRDIAAGEEITLDYAPLVSDHDDWKMSCACGSPDCRKVITSRDWQKPELQSKLWNEWLPFIQEMIGV